MSVYNVHSTHDSDTHKMKHILLPSLLQLYNVPFKRKEYIDAFSWFANEICPRQLTIFICTRIGHRFSSIFLSLSWQIFWRVARSCDACSQHRMYIYRKFQMNCDTMRNIYVNGRQLYIGPNAVCVLCAVCAGVGVHHSMHDYERVHCTYMIESTGEQLNAHYGKYEPERSANH